MTSSVSDMMPTGSAESDGNGEITACLDDLGLDLEDDWPIHGGCRIKMVGLR